MQIVTISLKIAHPCLPLTTFDRRLHPGEDAQGATTTLLCNHPWSSVSWKRWDFKPVHFHNTTFSNLLQVLHTARSSGSLLNCSQILPFLCAPIASTEPVHSFLEYFTHTYDWNYSSYNTISLMIYLLQSFNGKVKFA